jgi:hypothetical protein
MSYTLPYIEQTKKKLTRACAALGEPVPKTLQQVVEGIVA